jgi:Mrp family chromosome partitioning ATPase
MSPLRKYSLRVARWWVLVVVLAVAGGVLSAIWSISTTTTTWTATTALSSQSQLRAPEQDGVLAIGYVDYFNQESYQQLLRAKAGVPEDVTLSAQTGASSPIIYLSASGPGEDVVRDAAASATEAFREDVRQSLVAERRRAADDLQGEIDKNVEALNTLARTDVEKNVILDQIRSLQGRLTEFLADDTNHLKQLQPEPGVSSSTPSPVLDIVTGLFGGAALGILLALVLSVVDRRVRNAEEVQEAAGVPVLAELPRGDDGGLRMQTLLNSVTNAGTGGTTVVAVVAARRSEGVAGFAHQLAGAWPARRGGVLHVLADLRSRRPGYEGTPGLVDVLDGRKSVFDTAVARTEGFWVLPPGDAAGIDPYALADPRLVAGVLQDASNAVTLVVVEAPPLLEAPESELVCAAVDLVILLVDENQTRGDDLSKAIDLLRSAKAHVAGIVIDGSGGELATRRPAPTTADRAPHVGPLTPRAVAAVEPEPVADVIVESEPVADEAVESEPVADAAVESGPDARPDHVPHALPPTPYPRVGLVSAAAGSSESNGSKDGM